jgi:archaellum component FlaC
MFERSCRLTLSKRSRHLFERLKTPHIGDTELIAENKQLNSQLEQMSQRLQEIHDETAKLQAKLQEKDQFYLSKLQTANSTNDELSQKLSTLKHQFSSVEQNAHVLQKRLESFLLDEEHRLVDEQLADTQQEEIQRLRYELTLSHQQNQELRERYENLLHIQTKPVHSEQLHISKRISDAQLNNLKAQLQKSRDTVEEWTQRYKQLEQNYTHQFEQRVELETSTIRAAKVGVQI